MIVSFCSWLDRIAVPWSMKSVVGEVEPQRVTRARGDGIPDQVHPSMEQDPVVAPVAMSSQPRSTTRRARRRCRRPVRPEQLHGRDQRAAGSPPTIRAGPRSPWPPACETAPGAGRQQLPGGRVERPDGAHGTGRDGRLGTGGPAASPAAAGGAAHPGACGCAAGLSPPARTPRRARATGPRRPARSGRSPITVALCRAGLTELDRVHRRAGLRAGSPPAPPKT